MESFGLRCEKNSNMKSTIHRWNKKTATNLRSIRWNEASLIRLNVETTKEIDRTTPTEENLIGTRFSVKLSWLSVQIWGKKKGNPSKFASFLFVDRRCENLIVFLFLNNGFNARTIPLYLFLFKLLNSRKNFEKRKKKRKAKGFCSFFHFVGSLRS